MSRYIKLADVLRVLADTCYLDEIDENMQKLPSIEPNLILPEQMGRGDIYEVGETIVVMNHDDYYDLLCKSWVPIRGEWIEHEGKTIVMDNNFVDFFPTEYECSNCGLRQAAYFINSSLPNYCPNCGAQMKGADDE